MLLSAEPDLSREALAAALRAQYGLEVHALTFLGRGTAPSYQVSGPSGTAFVKVLPPTPYGRGAAARQRAEVPLLRALKAEGVLERVPEPRPTLDGEPLGEVEDHALSVYAWLDAAPLDDLPGGWAAARVELAAELGRLHAGTGRVLARLDGLPVPPDDLALLFEQELLADLEALRSLPAEARPGLHALADLVLAHEAEVLSALAEARCFQAQARALNPVPVLCHTDAHGGNVLRGSGGGLWLIDWETARLAPPEHDLWMLGDALGAALEGYSAFAGASLRARPALLAFYLYRRVLEDLAADVGWMLREHTRPEQDAASLGVLERHILPDLRDAETRLERLLG